jgi:hypothetical protein
LAISIARAAFTSGQKDDETAKTAALENCQRLLDAINSKARCDLYAVGDTVVYSRGRPPMPPEPWINRDPAIEQTFAAKDIPLLNDNARASADNRYAQGRDPKALAMSPQGTFDRPASMRRRVARSRPVVRGPAFRAYWSRSTTNRWCRFRPA